MKFIQKHSGLIGHFSFGFYQHSQRIEFSLILDWSDNIPIFELTFLLWCFEITYYKNRRDFY